MGEGDATGEQDHESALERAAAEARATAAMAAAAIPSSGGGAGLTGHYFTPQSPEGLEATGLQTTYYLRPAVASLAYLPAGLSDADVRVWLAERFHRHMPIHRTAVVLLTKGA